MSRRLATLIGAAALLLGVALTSPAHATQGSAASGILTIGDSVMLGAKWQLQQHGVTVDAAKSRFPRDGVRVLRGKRGASDVVIHLGTNGQLVARDCRALVTAADAAERVYLVTIRAPRDYARRNNAVIRSCAASFPGDRVRIIDWASAAGAHPAWLYSDGIHLRPAGAKAFTRLILSSVRQARGSA